MFLFHFKFFNIFRGDGYSIKNITVIVKKKGNISDIDEIIDHLCLNARENGYNSKGKIVIMKNYFLTFGPSQRPSISSWKPLIEV